MLPQETPPRGAQRPDLTSALLLWFLLSLFPLLTLPAPGTSFFLGMRRWGHTSRGQPPLTRSRGWSTNSQAGNREPQRGVGLGDRVREEGESHAGLFHQVLALCGFEAGSGLVQLLRFSLGFSQRKCPEHTSRNSEDTGLQSHLSLNSSSCPFPSWEPPCMDL